MTDRDRLIELNRNAKLYAQEKADERGGLVCIDDEVDYLLANGVIVPPCKVGDTIWYKEGKYFLDSYTVKVIDISEERTRIYASNISRDAVFNANDFGKSVFLTKEEAEEKLKEREGK